MSYNVGSVISAVCVTLNSDESFTASQNPHQFVAFYKKACKADYDAAQYDVAVIGITEASDFGFEGEVIGGSAVGTGESAHCSKKGYWVIDGREYIEFEYFKVLFKSVLTTGLIKYLNSSLRPHKKPMTMES